MSQHPVSISDSPGSKSSPELVPNLSLPDSVGSSPPVIVGSSSPSGSPTHPHQSSGSSRTPAGALDTPPIAARLRSQDRRRRVKARKPVVPVSRVWQRRLAVPTHKRKRDDPSYEGSESNPPSSVSEELSCYSEGEVEEEGANDPSLDEDEPMVTRLADGDGDSYDSGSEDENGALGKADKALLQLRVTKRCISWLREAHPNLMRRMDRARLRTARDVNVAAAMLFHHVTIKCGHSPESDIKSYPTLEAYAESMREWNQHRVETQAERETRLAKCIEQYHKDVQEYDRLTKGKGNPQSVHMRQLRRSIEVGRGAMDNWKRRSEIYRKYHSVASNDDGEDSEDDDYSSDCTDEPSAKRRRLDRLVNQYANETTKVTETVQPHAPSTFQLRRMVKVKRRRPAMTSSSPSPPRPSTSHHCDYDSIPLTQLQPDMEASPQPHRRSRCQARSTLPTVVLDLTDNPSTPPRNRTDQPQSLRTSSKRAVAPPAPQPVRTKSALPADKPTIVPPKMSPFSSSTITSKPWSTAVPLPQAHMVDEIIMDVTKSTMDKRALLSRYPELISQWHPTKNKGLDPSKMMASSTRVVWWKCPLNKLGRCGCEHAWLAPINLRVESHAQWFIAPERKVRGAECPYCNKMQPEACPHTSLAATHPQLATEWHPTHNRTLDLDVEDDEGYPVDYSSPSGIKACATRRVWWKCAKSKPCRPGCKAEHVWASPVARRADPLGDRGCPYCDGRAQCPCNKATDVSKH